MDVLGREMGLTGVFSCSVSDERKYITYLNGFSAQDLEHAATRVVTQPRWEGKVMSGEDYFREHALPNFYTAHLCAILRHNGVPLGKRDFLGALSLKAP